MRTAFARTALLLALTAPHFGCAGDPSSPALPELPGEPGLPGNPGTPGVPDGYTNEGTRPADAELVMLALWMGSDMTRLAVTHPSWAGGGYSWAPPVLAGSPSIPDHVPPPEFGLNDRVCSTIEQGSWTDANGNGIGDAYAYFTTCNEVDTIGGRILQHRDSMVGVVNDSSPGSGQNWVSHTFVMMRYLGPEGFDSGWSRSSDIHVTTASTRAETQQSNRTMGWGMLPATHDSTIYGADVHAIIASDLPMVVGSALPPSTLVLDGGIYRFVTDSLAGHADSAVHAVVFATDSAMTFGTSCSWPVDGWLKGHIPALPLAGNFLEHFHDCSPYPDFYWSKLTPTQGLTPRR